MRLLSEVCTLRKRSLRKHKNQKAIVQMEKKKPQQTSSTLQVQGMLTDAKNND